MSALSDCYYWQAYSPESTNQYSLLMPFMNPALLIVSQPFLITLQAVKKIIINFFCRFCFCWFFFSVRGCWKHKWFQLETFVDSCLHVLFYQLRDILQIYVQYRVYKNWLGLKFDKNRKNFACNATRLASKNSTFSEYTKYNLSNITFLSYLLALLTLT